MRFVIQGQSMYPFLKPTDRVTLMCIPRSKVRVGDMVAYFDSASKLMIVHRVIGKHGRKLKTKGDNNKKTDDIAVGGEKVLVVNKISKQERIIDVMCPFHRNIVNIIFLLLSVTRVNFLFFGRKIQYSKKIGGRLVSDKVYNKYKKYISINEKHGVIRKK